MNFADAIRADNFQILTADVSEGHKSTAMCHMANIAYRAGEQLIFDPNTEQFVGNEVANGLLKRNRYRYPYVIPEVV